MVRLTKVVLPLGSPEGTLKLCKKIVARHLLLGAGSPVIGFLDMAAFEAKRAAAALAQENGDTAMRNSQAFNGQAKKICGIAKGQNKQTEGTLYWYVLQIRDVLLIKNRLEEENLSQWGFNVVISQTGGRRNVRVDIPNDSAEELSALAATIKAKHEELELGTGSPLTGAVANLADFMTKTTNAVAKVEETETEQANAQAFHGQALTQIGYSEGQQSTTEGTLYFDIITIRDRLLQVNQGEEENLSQWGFDVVITGHGVAGNTSATVVVQIEISMGLNGVINIPDLELDGKIISMVDFEAKDSDGKFYAAVNETDVLPPAGPNIEVLNGQKISRTPAQIESQIGFGDEKPHLKVLNTGSASGLFTVTLHIAG